MTAAPVRARLVTLSAARFADRVDEALDVYAQAMGYPRGAIRQRGPLWRDHSNRAGWLAVAAVDRRGGLVGIGYGYVGGPGQWWYDEVRRGLAGAGPAEQDWLADYFELTELHVRPGAQGGGLGEAMLRELLGGTDRRVVLLSTPERGPDRAGRAWRLYRRIGFDDVLRRYHFTGDPRPFAVLGRTLPLPAPPTDPPPHPG